jgi:hypothetical protein
MPPLHIQIKSLYSQWVDNLTAHHDATDGASRKYIVELLNSLHKSALSLQKEDPSSPFLKLILQRPVEQHLLISGKSKPLV